MVTRTLVRLAAPRWLCVAIVAWSACSSPLPPPAEQTDEIDFYQASGITQPELAGFLEGLEVRETCTITRCTSCYKTTTAITWRTAA